MGTYYMILGRPPHISVGGYHDDHGIAVRRPDLPEHVHPVHFGHSDIHDDEIEVLSRPCIEGLPAVLREADPVVFVHENVAEECAGVFLIVDDEYSGFLSIHNRPFQLTLAGREMMNVVPFPGSLSTSILPLWSWMIQKTRLSPMPVPFPALFVVKKGSNILDMSSGGIP